ncbi:MAG: hypothetical protein LBS74_00215 [Oscillospiraceae bacterium]|jgi:hypothetical protein|nr:hypothetical protein [Oscillospiraceae bacterium]
MGNERIYKMSFPASIRCWCKRWSARVAPKLTFADRWYMFYQFTPKMWVNGVYDEYDGGKWHLDKKDN